MGWQEPQIFELAKYGILQMKVNWRTLIFPLGICMLLGCSDSRERSSKIELCPTNIDELVSLSAEDLERVDWAINFTKLFSM